MTASPPLLLLLLFLKKAFACTKMRAIWRCGKREGFFYLLRDAEKHRFCKRYSQVFGVKELAIFMSTEEGRKGRIYFTFEAKKSRVHFWQAGNVLISPRDQGKKVGKIPTTSFPPSLPQEERLLLRGKGGNMQIFSLTCFSLPPFYMLPSLPPPTKRRRFNKRSFSTKMRSEEKTMGKFLPK